MKNIKRIIALLLIIALLSVSVICAGAAAADLPAANSCPRHAVCTSLSQQAQNYYKGEYSYASLSALGGAQDVSDGFTAFRNNELYTKLHQLMTETQTYNTTYSGYKKGSLAYYWASTDAVSGGDTYVMFYSDVPGDQDGIQLNREHIWPKSRASYQTKNGGADLHHLRPAVSTVNNAKSDHYFGYIRNTYDISAYTTGYVGDSECYLLKRDKDAFECKDDVKGDVARILLYVYCRWQQPNLYTDMTENLPAFDEDDTTNSGKRVVESLDTLLQWCETDPVDTWEMQRNDLTQQVQGNRNVFIDYPELAWQMFGRETPAGMATPTQTGCDHNYTEVVHNNASCTRNGHFVLRCGNCGNTLEQKIAAVGHKDSNGDGKCDLCGKQNGVVIIGDADGDNAVTIHDVTAIQRCLAQLDTLSEEDAADVDGNGSVTITDATLIQMYLAEYDDEYGIGNVKG